MGWWCTWPPMSISMLRVSWTKVGEPTENIAAWKRGSEESNFCSKILTNKQTRKKTPPQLPRNFAYILVLGNSSSLSDKCLELEYVKWCHTSFLSDANMNHFDRMLLQLSHGLGVSVLSFSLRAVTTAQLINLSKILKRCYWSPNTSILDIIAETFWK